MKHAFIALFWVAIGAQAQNVGIGTASPTQKLDVNGNVNISGTIIANGTAGTAGQALISTGNGLAWATIGSGAGYKHFAMYYNGSGTWTVPAGVTEIMVEMWGAGSGGSTDAGGTSGAYLRFICPVTPGTGIPIVVGSGSPGSTAGMQTVAGGASSVTVDGNSFIALGGGGLTINGVKGQQTSVQVAGGQSNWFFASGNPGEANRHSYGMKNSTTYVETIAYGEGGAPVGLLNSHPVTGDVLRYENGVLVYKMAPDPYNRTVSSGGAAGTPSGHKGGDGMIIIWYN